MGVDGGTDGAGVAEVDLELAKVFTLLQEMGCIAVTQRMDMRILFDAAGAQGQAEAALESGALHGLSGGGSALAAVAFGREDKTGIAMRAPELAEQFEGALGQRHVAVTVAFATPDVQEHALRVDVADLQLEGFAQAQAAGIDGDEGDAVVQGFDLGQDPADFGSRENDRQFELGSGACQFQFRRPTALEGLLPEELDGAQSLGGALAGEAALALQVDEVLAEVLGAELVGGAVEVLGELAQAGPVALLAAGLEGQQGQVIGEAFEDCVGGAFFICIVPYYRLLLAVCPASVRGEPSTACRSLGQPPMQNHAASIRSAKPQELRPPRRVAASFNYRTPADAGIASLFHIGHTWSRTAECGHWASPS